MGDLSSLSMGPSNGVLHPALKSMKRTIRKRREFIGWGSASLIEFFISIDKDPSRACSLLDVTNIINEYITNNRLTDRVKKKRVVCDERLLSVLGKRTVNRNKIRDLVEPHLLECQDSSEDEELSDNSEEGEGASKSCKRQRKKGLDDTNGTIKIKLAPRSCFASILTQNIKLVYLKRSLVQNLSKQPDTFDGKVIGSFVRVKSDPNDYLQKNSHQLLQVTGIQKALETGDSSTGIILQLSNMSDGVQIRMLSDDDFTEEECKDLRQRVKDGQVKRLTTWDLEGKARVLHQDITYHWIERELALLQNLIDRASEKGWHRERFEYLERRELLQSPSERERLIQEVPLVIADEIEVEPPTELPGDENLDTNHSPRSIPADPNSKSNNIAHAIVQSDLITEGVQHGGNVAAEVFNNLQGLDGMSSSAASAVANINMGNKDRIGEIVDGRTTDKVEAAASVYGNQNKLETDVKEARSQLHSNGIEEQHVSIEDDKQWNYKTTNLIVNKYQEKVVEKREIVVIDLDDEDEDDGDACGNLILDNPYSSIWYYLDPTGKVQGPFSMSMLKGWKSKDFFEDDFRVWKTGQTKEAAILLTDAISQVFPSR